MAKFSVWASFASAPLGYYGCAETARDAARLGDCARRAGAIRVQFHMDGQLVRTAAELSGHIGCESTVGDATQSQSAPPRQ